MKLNITTAWLFKKGFRYVQGRWVKRGTLGERKVRVVLHRDSNSPDDSPGVWDGLVTERLGFEFFPRLYFRQHVNAVLRFAFN